MEETIVIDSNTRTAGTDPSAFVIELRRPIVTNALSVIEVLVSPMLPQISPNCNTFHVIESGGTRAITIPTGYYELIGDVLDAIASSLGYDYSVTSDPVSKRVTVNSARLCGISVTSGTRGTAAGIIIIPENNTIGRILGFIPGLYYPAVSGSVTGTLGYDLNIATRYVTIRLTDRSKGSGGLTGADLATDDDRQTFHALATYSEDTDTYRLAGGTPWLFSTGPGTKRIATIGIQVLDPFGLPASGINTALAAIRTGIKL